MKLKDCTKEELIFVIERLQLYTLSGTEYVQRALEDVEMRRDERKHEEARRLAALHSQKCLEYVGLLTPYDGKPFKDIPLEVLERAEAAMKEARDADAKWRRLMGFSVAKSERKRSRSDEAIDLR